MHITITQAFVIVDIVTTDHTYISRWRAVVLHGVMDSVSIIIFLLYTVSDSDTTNQ